MSEDGRAEIVICLRDGSFQVRGSEAFVTAEVEKLRSLIKDSLAKGEPMTPAVSTKAATVDTGGTPSPSGGLQKYENLFAAEGDVLNILKTPSGGSTSQKAQQLAMLHTYGRLLQGQEAAPWDEVRGQCKAHGCLDSGNFASQMTAIKEHVIIVKNGGARTLKLTVPGRKAAEALADSLNG